MNLCTACNLDFASVTAFDKHRVGRHAFTFAEGLEMIPAREDGRRCLDADEMSAFAQDARGRWGLVEHWADARRAFSVDPGTPDTRREAA